MPDRDLLIRAETARQDGNPLAVFDLAQAAIESGTAEPRFQYLQVLALAQMGDTLRAEELYDRYGLGGRLADEDAVALRGRLHKDRALAEQGEARRVQFDLASRAYRQAFAIRSGYFPAINAATTAWVAGDKATALPLAQQLLAHPDLNPPDGFFASASRAEALALTGHPQAARDVLAAVLAKGQVGYGDRASAYRQMAWLSPCLDIGPADQASLLEILRAPPVVTYTGHMFRADEPAEDALLQRIRSVLDQSKSTLAYGSLACGADILIAEEVLRRGGELNIVLPFLADDFIAASVRPGGEPWVRRFNTCLEAASSVTYATRMDYVEHEGQFAYGSQFAMGLAQLRATNLATSAVQIAVWDGTEPTSLSGASVDVANWRALGRETHTVHPGAIDRRLARPTRPTTDPAYKRETRAIIFTDYKGFSKLLESAVPTFNTKVMGRVAQVLNLHSADICCRNSWGDALYAVVSGAPEAAEVVLEIIESLKHVRLSDDASPEQEGMRIGLHIGPVYRAIDPVTGLDNFYGSEVTLTARIEPRVVPGEIYATQAFAAILAMTAPDRFVTSYVGRVELAKGYGVAPIYRLERHAKI